MPAPNEQPKTTEAMANELTVIRPSLAFGIRTWARPAAYAACCLQGYKIRVGFNGLGLLERDLPADRNPRMSHRLDRLAGRGSPVRMSAMGPQSGAKVRRDLLGRARPV